MVRCDFASTIANLTRFALMTSIPSRHGLVYRYVVRGENLRYPRLKLRLLADPDQQAGPRQDRIRFASRPLQILTQAVWNYQRLRYVAMHNRYLTQLGPMEV